VCVILGYIIVFWAMVMTIYDEAVSRGISEAVSWRIPCPCSCIINMKIWRILWWQK